MGASVVTWMSDLRYGAELSHVGKRAIRRGTLGKWDCVTISPKGLLLNVCCHEAQRVSVRGYQRVIDCFKREEKSS